MTAEDLKQIYLSQIQNNWVHIKDIEDPDEEVQLFALSRATLSIKYIKNPTPRVQMEAVKRTCGMILHIANPCQEVIDYVLRNQDFIAFKKSWDDIIMKIFGQNTIMVNKWIRYGDRMRSLS
jgi:hypothetical protein